MQNKSFDFIGTPGGFFITLILTSLLQLIPIAGAVLGMNMMYGWMADNSLVSGRKVVYKAEFMETLVFLLVNVLLVMVTLGIYFFWFAPKMYKFVANHVSFADEAATPAAPMQAAVPQAPVA